MKTASHSLAAPSPLKRWMPAGLAILGLALAGLAVRERSRPLPTPPEPSARVAAQAQATAEASPAEAEKATPARKLSWRVVKYLQHDPGAFLQGLLWDSGGFYESTGLEGRSSLRRLDASGRVVKQVALPPEVFGEGLSAWKDSLIQISWKNGIAWRWDKATFAPRGQWKYSGEGWGITNDGRDLIMSDGSDTLSFRDPGTFAVRRTLRVTYNGRPVRDLNELEFIQGRVWANVWQTDIILLIDPKTGAATGYLDLAGILPPSARTGREDVLNGIAYDAATKRIWVSGKQWPRIFQIQVEGQN